MTLRGLTRPTSSSVVVFILTRKPVRVGDAAICCGERSFLEPRKTKLIPQQEVDRNVIPLAFSLSRQSIQIQTTRP